MAPVTRDALHIWFTDKVRRAGFADVESFSARFGLKPYRLNQIYRAATKEFVADIEGVTTLPKDLRASLKSAGFSFDSVTPVVVQRHIDPGPLQRGRPAHPDLTVEHPARSASPDL